MTKRTLDRNEIVQDISEALKAYDDNDLLMQIYEMVFQSSCLEYCGDDDFAVIDHHN